MDPHVGAGSGSLNDQYDRLMNQKVQISDPTGQTQAVSLRDFALLTGKGGGLKGKIVRTFQRRNPPVGNSPESTTVAQVTDLVESFHKIAVQYQKIGNHTSSSAEMDPAKVVSQNLENAKKLEKLSLAIKKYVEETSSQTLLSAQDVEKIKTADQIISSKKEGLEAAKNLADYLRGLDPYDVLLGSDDDEDLGQHEPLRFAFHDFILSQPNVPYDPYHSETLKVKYQEFVNDLLEKIAGGNADPQLINHINETKNTRLMAKVKGLGKKQSDSDKKYLFFAANREFRKLQRLYLSSVYPLLNHFGVAYHQAARTALALAENNQTDNRNFKTDTEKLGQIDPKRLTRTLYYDRNIESLLAIPPNQRTQKQQELLGIAQRPENSSTKGRTIGEAYAALVTGKGAISYSLMNFLYKSLGPDALTDQLCADLSDTPVQLSLKGDAQSFAVQGLTAGMTEVQRLGSGDRVIAFANGFPSGLDPDVANYMEAMEYATKDGGKMMLLSGAESAGDRKAAEYANKGFLTTVSNGLRGKTPPQTLKQLGHLSMAGIQAAHDTITANTKKGLATHCSVVAKLDANGRGTAIATSVGDMTILVRRANGNVEAITRGNRVADRADRGGQLGARLSPKANLQEEGPDYPQLSNLAVYQFELRPGDTVALMSPGVRDQLDPEKNGFNNPNEVRDLLLQNRKLLQRGDAVFLKDLGQLPTTWNEGDAQLATLKEIYAMYQSKVVVSEYPDKPFIEALTQHAFESANKSVRGYGTQFTSNKKVLTSNVSDKKIRFSPDAKVRVLYQATEEKVVGKDPRKREEFDELDTKTIEHGRFEGRKDLYKRNNFEDSVRAQVAHLDLDTHVVSKNVEFAELLEDNFETISLDQIYNACLQKLLKLFPESQIITYEAKFISEQLKELVATMPNPKITTLEGLKLALKDKILEKNKKTEELDNDTFLLLAEADLYVHEVRTLADSPEYKGILQRIQQTKAQNPEKFTGTDIAGVFTTYEIPVERLTRWNEALDRVFNHADAATVLANFLPDGGKQFRLGREELISKADPKSVARYKAELSSALSVGILKEEFRTHMRTTTDKQMTIDHLTSFVGQIIVEMIDDDPAMIVAKRIIKNELLALIKELSATHLR